VVATDLESNRSFHVNGHARLERAKGELWEVLPNKVRLRIESDGSKVREDLSVREVC